MSVEEQAAEYPVPITEWSIQAPIIEVPLCARCYIRCLDSLISLIVEGFARAQKEIFLRILGRGLIVQIFWAWPFDYVKSSSLKIIF